MAPTNKIQAEALEPVHKETGTAYPATRADIDFHREYKFWERNDGPFIDSFQATNALIEHNEPGRPLPTKEDAAIERLYDLVLDVAEGGEWGPDIAIKCFADLDLVFFGGALKNNVVVKWASCRSSKRLRMYGAAKCFGLTEYPHLRQKGQTRIVLNTDSILEEGRSLYSFKMLFSSLLHEMCHAYDHVVCPRNWLIMGWQNPHGEHFCTRITAVHRRAVRILGLQAIGFWEKYHRHHYFTEQDGEGFLSCGRHHIACDCHIDGTRRLSDTYDPEIHGESYSSFSGHDLVGEGHDDGFRSWNSAHMSSMREESGHGHYNASEELEDETRSWDDSQGETLRGDSDDEIEEDEAEENREEEDSEEEDSEGEDGEGEDGEEEDEQVPSRWDVHDPPWQGDAHTKNMRRKHGDGKGKKCVIM